MLNISIFVNNRVIVIRNHLRLDSHRYSIYNILFIKTSKYTSGLVVPKEISMNTGQNESIICYRFYS